MGRKKIQIQYIEAEVKRRITFKARIGGLIKKLHDLSVLCGVQVSMVMTDPENNLVAYSNSQDIHLVVKKDFNQSKEDYSVKVYTAEDVYILFLINENYIGLTFKNPFIRKEPKLQFKSYIELLYLNRVSHKSWKELEGFHNIPFTKEARKQPKGKSKHSKFRSGKAGNFSSPLTQALNQLGKREPNIPKESKELYKKLKIKWSETQTQFHCLNSDDNSNPTNYEMTFPKHNVIGANYYKKSRNTKMSSAQKALSIDYARAGLLNFSKFSQDIQNNPYKFKVSTPPNETEIINQHLNHVDTYSENDHDWSNLQSFATIKIDDGMIKQYQKLDLILNYGMEQFDLNFSYFCKVKNFLDFYFIKYVPKTTERIQSFPQSDIKYILSLAQKFTKKEVALIKITTQKIEQELMDEEQTVVNMEFDASLHHQSKNVDMSVSSQNNICFTTQSQNQKNSNTSKGSRIKKLKSMDFNDTQLQNSLKIKLNSLGFELKGVCEILMHFFSDRKYLENYPQNGGISLTERITKYNHKFPLAESISSFMRKLLIRYRNNILLMKSESQIHEYLTNQHQMFKELVTAAYLPDPGIIDLEAAELKWGKKIKLYLIDFCKVVCQLYMDILINGCSKFNSKLSRYSLEAAQDREQRLNGGFNGISEFQKYSFLNEISTDEFKRVVSNFGSNPLTNVYDIEYHSQL